MIRPERIAALRKRALNDVATALADHEKAGRRDDDPRNCVGALDPEDAPEVLRVYGPELFDADERDRYLRHARAALRTPESDEYDAQMDGAVARLLGYDRETP